VKFAKRLLLALAAMLMLLPAAFALSANASVSPGPITLTGNQWDCSHTTHPAYMLHAGNAYVTSYPSSYKFTAVHEGAHFNGVYDTVGYMGGLNSGWYCDHHRNFHPPKLGRIGNPVVSSHYVTSASFLGDTGFDIWLEPNASYNTYAKMTCGGRGTEAMIWTSRPDWRSWAKGKPVVIAGHRWYVVSAHVGHNGGWKRVFFVPVGSHNGNVSISHMRLDPFFSYMVKHGLASQSDVLEALDNGAELSAGSMSLAGYSLTGLTGENPGSQVQVF
jgi:hypothetical protein